MAKKYFVSGAQHYGITGQLLEIQRQVRTKDGSPIDPEKLRIALQEIIEPGYKERVSCGDVLPQGMSHLVLERARSSGYLDASFDDREVHPFVIRPLTKKQAFAEYRDSGGETWVWDELENSAPYVVPETKWLNVMILTFGAIESNGVSFEMDKLGVRPLVYEELIQYGITYPEHQKRNPLIAIGSIQFLRFRTRVPVLHSVDSKRSLDSERWKDCKSFRLGENCRFLVVPK